MPFFGHGPQVGPKVFLTDDSSAERNALKLCWPEGIRLLCTFHILQKMKEILYTKSGSEMHTHYKQMFYGRYPQLRKHFEILWERHCFMPQNIPSRKTRKASKKEQKSAKLKQCIGS
uniref:Uncharacterized protein n=1 Tax=Rhizophagus irregularis (strain DAOM 181602 / DAOM 197198 / MUCL 43194) TaxID=747089 RepID=U9SSX8_RHIID